MKYAWPKHTPPLHFTRLASYVFIWHRPTVEAHKRALDLGLAQLSSRPIRFSPAGRVGRL